MKTKVETTGVSMDDLSKMLRSKPKPTGVLDKFLRRLGEIATEHNHLHSHLTETTVDTKDKIVIWSLEIEECGSQNEFSIFSPSREKLLLWISEHPEISGITLDYSCLTQEEIDKIKERERHNGEPCNLDSYFLD